ncbi:MAG: hypothetical protein J5784_00615 [Muribaculaceae bacterium]|nr:hypothetical protein [Muribaculaceae bacterium]MBP5315011.1 hypothetical protein [Muribaculaceae bacterium]MBR4721727.1 hypothetical protein [Muribaculaceae bacterium]MBR5744719.1 hypothetical protein [Muribaculaceae bacterium]
MNEDDKRQLTSDPDGLLTYEYIANNIDDPEIDIESLADNMIRVDATGQFVVSAARYLHAIDSKRFASPIERLIAAAIEKDREHRYIGDLLQSIWGDDYAQHVDELNASDDNFRRIYKRLFPKGI